ncbi:MAG: tRNA (adenosine(37)-N6)-dimethylallyltransferase MiaA [Moraxella sp.]|nr:tRNA (adenosine(37)-N6)-dimethylallyltransferase MiaA [Moraxella sp.]
MKQLFYKNLPEHTVLSLIAPTASGKTDLAFLLYDTGRFELISVDSALIYRDMNIGTAKPTTQELTQYPHHLVNIIDPTQSYSVANFVNDVKHLIYQSHQRGKIPLLVGGSMMYYMALFDGLSAVPETQAHIRAQVMDWLSEQGIGDLYAYLKSHDPVICQRLRASDTQRITRAVEVHLQTGVPMSVWQSTPKTALCHNKDQYWLALSVEPDRAWLHQRIEQRLELMWQAGFVDEVMALIQTYPLSPDMPSMRCVGYRQVLEFLIAQHYVVQDNTNLERNLSKRLPFCRLSVAIGATNVLNGSQKTTNKPCQDMKNKALYATRQLAKRQSTWQRQLLSLNHKPTIIDTSQEALLHHISPVIVSFDSIKQVKHQLLS